MNKSHYLIRILDDDPEFLDAISFLLETEGWKTVCCSSPELLFSNLTDQPGCIILDVRMPALSGPEVQAKLSEENTACR